MPRPRLLDHIQFPFYLPRKDAKELKRLSAKTRVPQQQYAREAIADLLVKYAKELRT